MSGRGRGVSNMPAWMTRQQQQDGGPSGLPPPPPPPSHRRDRSRSPPDRRGRYDDRRRDYRGGGDYRRDDGYRRDDRRYHDRRGPPPRDRRGPPSHRRRSQPARGISFKSYEEEMAWVEERRRKRKSRPSLFDVPPTAEQALQDAQAATMANPAATDFSGLSSNNMASHLPQQTRHARRLYVGNLPANVSEDELHHFFRSSIETALGHALPEDPILSVYINQERRFCFLEFKSVEMTTACLALDGVNVHGKGKVKIKRPNDYNPSMAPDVHPSALPPLDVSKLGIVSTTVPDGPNKIFIGGLHYHLAEDQLLGLLGAFGKVKGFHLVKSDPDATTSKGYGFVEYQDPAVTTVAVAGLHGMDLGGGKILTARVANAKDNALSGPAVAAGAAPTSSEGLPPGVYHVEELVDAAMGLRPMPIAPSLQGQPAIPLTPSTPVLAAPPPLSNAAPVPPLAAAVPSVLDIANAAQAALSSGAPPLSNTAPPGGGGSSTPILVLLNMVMDQDLATPQAHSELLEDVRSECAKFGKLLSIKIPRPGDTDSAPSAVKKVFLEYATVTDAMNAQKELNGRQFGPNLVQTSYFSQQDYKNGKLA